MFIVAHAIWIVPIWGLFAVMPVAMLVGAVASRPFAQLHARGTLPPPPFDGVAFAAILLATLVPTVAAGVVLGPVDPDAVTVANLVLPLLLAVPAGALLGGLLAGSLRGAAALAIAAAALALTLGHNLPFFPLGSRSWELAFALVGGVELSAGVAFTAARALFTQLSSAA